MERIVNQQYAELIAEGMSAVPNRILDIIGPVHFFTGTDPYFAGLETDDDGSYRWKNRMHFLPIGCQLHLPQSLRWPTIVIPDSLDLSPGDVVHELGHALDYNTPWYTFQTGITPVTEYAKTDEEEAFAEAFASWLFWDYGNDRDIDEETLALFNRLAR